MFLEHHEFFLREVTEGRTNTSDTKTGLAAPSKGHPVDAKSGMIVHHEDGC